MKMFPDNDAARVWFESKIWPDGPYCPHCGSYNVQCGVPHKSMTHRCGDCKGRSMFNLKTCNLMEGSKLGYQTWAIAIYLVTTNLNGASSMKLHHDLEITQKSAWHLAHRIRKAYEVSIPLFAGPVKVDETNIGSKRNNILSSKRKELERCVPVQYLGSQYSRSNCALDQTSGREASQVQGFNDKSSAIEDLRSCLGTQKFGTILADPPWRFTNRTGKVAPEHRRLSRYETMSFDEIGALPIVDYVTDTSHCYLWVPNALLPAGLQVLADWGFEYKTNIIWHKIRKDGGSNGRGVGFYFRNVTEVVLFGVRGKKARTLQPGRSQVNLMATRKREHSRKPDEQYEIIENCSWGPYLELFGRGQRKNWTVWGRQAETEYKPDWPTYSYNSASIIA